MGANAVIMMRFDSSEIGQTMSDIAAYGTTAVLRTAMTLRRVLLALDIVRLGSGTRCSACARSCRISSSATLSSPSASPGNAGAAARCACNGRNPRQATGERFVDPEAQELVKVWYDLMRGERHYLRVASRT
jgi:hypothetical protein